MRQVLNIKFKTSNPLTLISPEQLYSINTPPRPSSFMSKPASQLSPAEMEIVKGFFEEVTRPRTPAPAPRPTSPLSLGELGTINRFTAKLKGARHAEIVKRFKAKCREMKAKKNWIKREDRIKKEPRVKKEPQTKKEPRIKREPKDEEGASGDEK